MTEFLHSTSTGDFKMLGLNPAFSAWTEPPNLDEVPEVRSLFAHNAPHLLLSDFVRPLWVGDMGGGWLDAGAGHWYEYELFERTTHYCIEEATAPGGYEKGRWRAPVRKRLERETEPQLPRLLAKRGHHEALQNLAGQRRPPLRRSKERLENCSLKSAVVLELPPRKGKT